MGGRLIRAVALASAARARADPGPPRRGRRFAFRATERAKVRETLKTIHDVERLVGARRSGPRAPATSSLRQSIAAIPRVRCWWEMQAPLVRSLLAEIDDLADIRDDLARTLLDETAGGGRDGGMIRDGVDASSTSCAASAAPASNASPRWKKRSARAPESVPEDPLQPGVRLLHRDLEVEPASVPADYHRKQTIAGGERFITPALKEYEEKVLGADERIIEREVEHLRAALRQKIAARRRACWTRPRHRGARRAFRAGRDRGGGELHQADGARRRGTDRHRRAPSGRRALRAGRLRAERRHARRRQPIS